MILRKNQNRTAFYVLVDPRACLPLSKNEEELKPISNREFYTWMACSSPHYSSTEPSFVFLPLDNYPVR